MESSLLEAALAAAGRGWSVLPIRSRAKAPLVPWLELQERRAHADEIRAWFARWPDANVGIVTGAISGLVVVDVDPGHGGRASLADLESEIGKLPPTVEAITGGRGRHLYFSHPGGTVPNRAGILPGIDVRGDGGSLVIPPSVHPSGRKYRWMTGRSPDNLTPARMPAALLARIRRRSPAAAYTLPHWRAVVREGVEEGRRNDTIASLTGHLLWHGVDPYVALQLLLSWNRAHSRPPLPDAEVARTVASISRLHERARCEDDGGRS